jgi:hypothetical protein
MSLQQCEFGIKRKRAAKSNTNHTMLIDLAMSGISFFEAPQSACKLQRPIRLKMCFGMFITGVHVP